MILVRHGETEWNHERLAQGHADIDLNERGQAQADAAAVALAGEPVEAVYASDLRRAVDTARAIARIHGLDVVTDPDLREIDQGEWEGLHVDEIERRWPHLWGPARHHARRPGGESPADVRARSLDVLRRIVEKHPEGTVVVASHGGPIRWLSAEALGYDDADSARLRGVSNGGAVMLDARIEDGRVVLGGFRRMDGAPPDRDDPNI